MNDMERETREKMGQGGGQWIGTGMGKVRGDTGMHCGVHL